MFLIVNDNKTVQDIKKVDKNLVISYTDETKDTLELNNEKTVKSIVKTEKGLKITYTDNTFEDIEIKAGNEGGGNVVIPKHVSNISADSMNDGIGVRYSDGKYERVSLDGLPTIKRTLTNVDVIENGNLNLRNTDGKYIKKPVNYFYNAELLDGVLSLKRGNDTQLDIDFKVLLAKTLEETPEREIKPLTYYKTIDNIKVEITKEEFNTINIKDKYYKIVDGVEIEISEEEFNK